MDQLPRLGKRELIHLLFFTCNYVVFVEEVSSSSGCLGLAFLWPSLSLPFSYFAGREHNHKSLDAFEFRPDSTSDCRVSCP